MIGILIPQANTNTSVTVFAASSLTGVFTDLGKQYESTHPDVKIVFSFHSSSTLASQIKSGAPADIFVSASPFEMSGVAKGSNYLVNRVVLAVPKNSEIKKVSDLNKSVTWIQCAHNIPCGVAADAALQHESVTSQPVSLELKASSTVAKLLAGEVDAAIIYRTDVLASGGKLRAIEFVDKKSASTTYQFAQLRKDITVTAVAKFLKSPAVKKILYIEGFTPR